MKTIELGNKSRVVTFGLALVITLILVFSYSHARFVKSIDGENVTLKVGALSYSLASDSLNGAYQVTVSPGGKVIADITITSLDNINSKYQMYYTSTNNLTNVIVGYANSSIDSPSGEMNAKGEKCVKVVIQNNSTSSVTITLGVMGGLANNRVEDIVLGSNQFKISQVIRLADITITSVKIDGVNANSIPQSGLYTLSNYTCDGGSTLIWDTYKKSIVFSSGVPSGESCSLEFTKNTNYQLLIDVANQGDYVAYEGNNGCKKGGTPITGSGNAESGNSCLGYNANDTLDTGDGTYGYCYSSRYKYYVKGWRVAYKDSSRAYLISAGSPECTNETTYQELGFSATTTSIDGRGGYYYGTEYTFNPRTGLFTLGGTINNSPPPPVGTYSCQSSTSTTCSTLYKIESLGYGLANAYENKSISSSYISSFNTRSLKYCNPNFIDGVCDNTNTWMISDNDFNKITSQMTGTSGGYLYTEISGAIDCGNEDSQKVCGYNNDLLDNGGYYWFATSYYSSNTNSVSWVPYYRAVIILSYNDPYGLRPIIRLSSSIYVTGGTGTMNDPYTIIKK